MSNLLNMSMKTFESLLTSKDFDKYYGNGGINPTAWRINYDDSADYYAEITTVDNLFPVMEHDLDGLDIALYTSSDDLLIASKAGDYNEIMHAYEWMFRETIGDYENQIIDGSDNQSLAHLDIVFVWYHLGGNSEETKTAHLFDNAATLETIQKHLNAKHKGERVIIEHIDR